MNEKKCKYGESRTVPVPLSAAQIPGGVAWHDPFFRGEKIATKCLRLHGLKKNGRRSLPKSGACARFRYIPRSNISPQDCLSWLRPLWYSSVCPGRFQGSTSHHATTASFTSTPIHSSLRRYINRPTLTAALNEQRINKQINKTLTNREKESAERNEGSQSVKRRRKGRKQRKERNNRCCKI